MSFVEEFNQGKDDILTFVQDVLPFPSLKEGQTKEAFFSAITQEQAANMLAVTSLVKELHGRNFNDALVEASAQKVLESNPTISPAEGVFGRAVGRSAQIQMCFDAIDTVRQQDASGAFTMKLDFLSSVLGRVQEPAQRIFSGTEGAPAVYKVEGLHQLAGTRKHVPA